MPLAHPAYASVTSADFIRQFGRWQDHATTQPIAVTHHGRRRLVVLSAARYEELIARPVSDAVDGATATPPDRWDARAMDHVAQGFLAFDADMTVTQINRAACAFLKVAAADVIGRTLSDRLPGIEESLGYAGLVRAVEAGCITSLEMPSFTYAGRWLRFETFPHGPGAACLFRDVTDELDARRAFDHRVATLAALDVHDGVGRARLTARGTFAQIDETLAGFAGFSSEGLSRARLVDILPVRLRVAASQEIEAVLAGAGHRVLDTSLLTRAGEEQPVRIALAPLKTLNAPDGAVAVATLR